jgi:hypothetical protein
VYDFHDESDDDGLMIDELPKKRRHTLESFSSLKLPSKLYLCFVQIISAVFLYLFRPVEQLPCIQDIFFMYFSSVTSDPDVMYFGFCQVIPSRVCSSTLLWILITYTSV